MARKRREPAGHARNVDSQVTFLAPDDATLLHLVRENLRLLSGLRSSYRPAAGNDSKAWQVRCPQDVFDLLAPEMEALPQEQMRVVLLDSRNRVLDVVMVYQGNVSTAELFRDAVVVNAPAVILVHNHPSGEPDASPEDIQMTRDAAQGARLLGIDLLDHVIVGRGRFVSLKDQGVL